MAFSKNTNVLPPVSGRTIRLDYVDSTNNYAMRLIDAATAAHGDIVLAERQTGGKGQRGKSWYDSPGESLLMSLIIAPKVGLDVQPAFLAAIAVAIAGVVKGYVASETVSIKWPNDIIIGDKKAVGILIENVVRGSSWQWAVVGIGVNVAQRAFPEDLPNAVSLSIASGKAPSVDVLAAEISAAVLRACAELAAKPVEEIFKLYNEYLYRRGELQPFRWGYDVIFRRVLDVGACGRLRVRNQDGSVEYLNHGAAEWVWR